MMIEKPVEQICIVGAVGSSVMALLITEYPSTRSTTLHLVNVIIVSLEVSSLECCSPSPLLCLSHLSFFPFLLDSQSFLKLELSFSCPSPLIRTTTLHCSGESSRRLLPVTHSPDLLRDPGRGRRFSYRLTAPQIAFIGALKLLFLSFPFDLHYSAASRRLLPVYLKASWR